MLDDGAAPGQGRVVTNPANATTTQSGRTYEWPTTGEVFDSVTTIIKGGTPTGWGLQRWLKTVNVRFAVEHPNLWMPLAERDPQGAIDYIVGESDRHRDAASVRGSDVHGWAEKVVLGTAVGEAPEAIRPYVEQFMRFLDDWRPDYEATEATVYSRRYRRYAGTLDWIARIEGHGLVLGDIKTKPDGKSVFGTEIGLQLAAYRFADFIGLPDGTEAPMPQVDGCLALVIHPSSYELIPVRADEWVFRRFLYVAEVRHYCEVESKTVLGRPLVPTPRTDQEVAV